VSAPNSLQIDAKNLSGLPAPELTIGDVVLLTVRQNPPEGLGSVALRGLLINAALPQNLQSGDKIQAQIVQKGDRVVFKLIGEVQSQTPSLQNIQALILKQIEGQFKEIFNSISAPQLKQLQPENVSNILKNAGLLRGAIERLIGNLLKTLPSGENLFAPSEILKELLNSATGNQLRVLRELARSLRNFVGNEQVNPELSQLKDLESEISRLLSDSAENNFAAAGLLKNFAPDLDSLNKGIPKGLPRGLENSTRALFEQLKSTLGKLSDTTEPKPSISSLMLNLQDQISLASAKAGALDQKSIEQLLRLAGQLDRLADAEEALHRVNPLLQALGEPAMILFPFLFQGLLAHSDITYQKPTKRKKQGGKSSKEESSDNFQRIKLNAPLPTFGDVGVDVLLNEGEILVKLKVSDAAASEFIASKFSELEKELNGLGFKQTTLSSGKIELEEALPEWSMNLEGFATKVIA